MSPGRKSKEEHKNQNEEQDKRQERADRILDAAADLIQRYGYKKTTIDDIARQAGVAKGTIYLHWKTRDQLFMDLLLREKYQAALKMQEELASDPEGTTLHTMSKYSVMAALRSPLLRAVMLRDHNILGDLMHEYYDQQPYMEQIQSYKTFLDYLRQHGLIRTDQTPEEQTHLLMSIVMGFLLADDYMPPEFQLSIERRGELVADTVRRTFAIRNPTETENETLNLSMNNLVQSIQNLQYEGKQHE